MKKNLITALLLTFILSFVGIGSTNVTASSVLGHNNKELENEELLNEPMVIAPCSMYGIHRMKLTENSGIVIKNKTTYDIVMFNALWYKCECGEEAFTNGKPHYAGWDVGNYITSGGIDYVLDTSGAWLYLTDYTKSTVPYATNLLGYEFVSDM